MVQTAGSRNITVSGHLLFSFPSLSFKNLVRSDRSEPQFVASDASRTIYHLNLNRQTKTCVVSAHSALLELRLHPEE